MKSKFKVGDRIIGQLASGRRIGAVLVKYDPSITNEPAWMAVWDDDGEEAWMEESDMTLDPISKTDLWKALS